MALKGIEALSYLPVIPDEVVRAYEDSSHLEARHLNSINKVQAYLSQCPELMRMIEQVAEESGKPRLVRELVYDVLTLMDRQMDIQDLERNLKNDSGQWKIE